MSWRRKFGTPKGKTRWESSPHHSITTNKHSKEHFYTPHDKIPHNQKQNHTQTHLYKITGNTPGANTLVSNTNTNETRYLTRNNIVTIINTEIQEEHNNNSTQKNKTKTDKLECKNIPPPVRKG